MENAKPATAKSIFVPYVLDIVAPLAGYFVVRWFGAQAFWALTAGGLIAGLSTLVNTIRHKGLDAVGTLVIIEIAASIALLLLIRDPRLLLIRPSFYTGVAAIYFAFTVFAGRPLTFDAAKPMAAKGGPERLAAYERAWDSSTEFRRIHKVVTLGFALAFLADSVLRVVIVYRFPLERSTWLSNLPHVVAMLLIIAASALAGRSFSRIVDEQLTHSRREAPAK